MAIMNKSEVMYALDDEKIHVFSWYFKVQNCLVQLGLPVIL